MGTLTCTHNLCFEQKYENSQNISPENCHFYSFEKSLFVSWACFRNRIFFQGCEIGIVLRLKHTDNQKHFEENILSLGRVLQKLCEG